MKNMLILALITTLFSCTTKNEPVTIESPSGNLAVRIETDENSKIFYEVIKKAGENETVIMDQSPLGLVRSDADFTQNLELEGATDPEQISESYTMVSGKQRNLSYTASESVLTFSNEAGNELQIVFRVFDQGVAFRYVFPGDSEEEFTVESEITGFKVPASADGWMSSYQTATPWGNPGYEADYLEVKAGTPASEEVGWAFPLLFKADDNWIFISEAGLDATYCGTHVKADNPDGLYTIAFPEANERLGDGEVNPSSALPWEMPWRFILVSDSLDVIVESNMVYHLSEPSKIEDTSWIEPGRASWEWWSSKGGRTVKNLKQFIDLAAEMGWEYSLVDAGWEDMPDGTIEDVIDYADEKNVGLLMWYNSGGRRDSSAKNEEFVMFNDDTREAEMQRLQDWGIKGIKVDFFATDKQFGIELYENIIQDAAKYNLLVNFHGSTMPRGWTRTYPNVLTLEAVRGAEAYRFSESYPEIAAEYNTIAAIVRGPVGPADYTPATFSDNRYPHKTTYGHELALPVIYESGIIHMADKPESYRSLPEEAIAFLKEVPAAWDETKLIKAVPGEVFVIARRKGDNLYIAGINGKVENQEISITLPGNMQNAIFVGDGDAPEEFNIKQLEEGKEEVTVNMLPNGGFVIWER
ncbi:MAG: glycoside hydrolase family 97 catalytic domain-containing protein [Prolixibacteraceae bacterium]